MSYHLLPVLRNEREVVGHQLVRWDGKNPVALGSYSPGPMILLGLIGLGLWTLWEERGLRKRQRNPRLTYRARRRLGRSRFAIPELRKLPIHDAGHIRAAMSRFGQVRGASRAQKRRAFHRIVRAALSHGIQPTGFVSRWG